MLEATKMSKIGQITQFVEKRKGAFAVSILIMRSGVRLRDYLYKTEDAESDLRKVLRTLPEVLSDSEINELRELAKIGPA